MAEALALVGVAGAAVQFIDVGFKVVILAVSVSEKYSDAPQCVRRALDLVQQLLQVANATTAKATWQRPVSEPNGGTSSPQSLHAPAVDAPHNVAEAIWKSCTAQAKVLNEQLEPVLKNLNDTGIRRTWKQLLTVGKLKKIDQALNDMERWKTLLGVYMGQESLLQINQLQHGIAVIHDNIDQINANLRKTERTFQKVVSEEALERSASQIRELHTCLLQGNLLGGQQLGWLNPMPSSESRQEVQLLRNEMRVEFGKFANSLNTQHKTFYASPARSSLHPPRPKRANDSSLVKSQGLASAPDKAIGVERHFRRQNMLKKSPAVHPGYLAGARPFSCLGRRYNWTKIYDLASSKLIMQSHSTRCECCIEQHKHKSTSLSACYRQNLAFLSGVLEFNFFIKTASEGWSIGTSLRTQRRVKNLLSIYKWEYKLLSKAHYWPSDMRMFGQLLASIARRELLEAFNSGRASPDDVDRNGDTLLHILAYQYSSWHAAFYVPMISTLLEMGADPNAFNDSMETAQMILLRRCTPQYDSPPPDASTLVNENLIEWSACNNPNRLSILNFAACIVRWPESIQDMGYPYISDIILRRSMDDLRAFVERGMQPHERTDRGFTPLHLAAGANWPEAVELLVANGADKYAMDSNGTIPLDVAIRTRCARSVEILLSKDLSSYWKCPAYRSKPRGSGLLISLDTNRLLLNEKIQDAFVEAVRPERFRLPTIRLYHTLPLIYVLRSSKDMFSTFALKLLSAGFHDIDDYDESGMTPLMLACFHLNWPFISFLLRNGVDISKCHRESNLTARHFLIHRLIILRGEMENLKRYEQEVKLLQAGFQVSSEVKSSCLCSPEGYNPTAVLCQQYLSFNFKKRSVASLLSFLDEPDIPRKIGRQLVLSEVFNRLDLTHTCIRLSLNSVRLFPEEDRLEIEEEEEEISLELQRIMEEYDVWESTFEGDISLCVDQFFDKIDPVLPPTRHDRGLSIPWRANDPDILGPGRIEVRYYISSRGEKIHFGHKEGIHEENMLRILFE